MPALSRTSSLLIALALFPALACNFLTGETTPTDIPATAQAVATPIPSSTPKAPKPTAFDLTTHEDEELGLQFSYPQSWEIESGNGFITIASSADLLASEQFDRQGAGVIFAVRPRDEFEGETLEEILVSMVEEFNFTDNEEIVDGPTMTTINEQDSVVAVIKGTNDDSGQSLVFRYTVVEQSGRVAVAAAVTLSEFAEQYQAVLEDVARSMRLSEPAISTAPDPQGTIEYGETVRGTVAEGQASSWSFIGVEGESLIVSVTPLEEQLDVTLDVLDRSGDSILEDGPVDDAFATEEVRGLELPASEEYVIVVRGFASASGDYELTLREAGAVGATQTISVNETLTGTLQENGQNEYAYTGQDEKSVTVVVQPEGELDVVVEIIGPDGSIISQEDSSYGREQLSFTPETDTAFYIRVRGFAGAAGDYTISLTAGGLSSDDPGTTILASGSLPENAADGHDFPFSAAEGDTIYAAIEPEGEFDVVVEIWDDDNDRLLDQIDLSFGREDVTVPVSETGNYFIKVLGFDGQAGDYAITMTGPPSVIFELVPGDTAEGRFGELALIEYVIRLDPNEVLQLLAEPDEETDVVLSVLTPEETLLAEADEGFSGEPESLSFTAPAEAAEGDLYLIRVSDFSGEGVGSFALSLDEG